MPIRITYNITIASVFFCWFSASSCCSGAVAAVQLRSNATSRSSIVLSKFPGKMNNKAEISKFRPYSPLCGNDNMRVASKLLFDYILRPTDTEKSRAQQKGGISVLNPCLVIASTCSVVIPVLRKSQFQSKSWNQIGPNCGAVRSVGYGEWFRQLMRLFIPCPIYLSNPHLAACTASGMLWRKRTDRNWHLLGSGFAHFTNEHTNWNCYLIKRYKHVISSGRIQM